MQHTPHSYMASVTTCYLVSFQSPCSELLQGWQHHYIILHLSVHFPLHWELLLYILSFCGRLNHRKPFFGVRFFLGHWWSKLYPCHSILKDFFAELFPNRNFIWSRYAPWRDERAYDTAVGTNSSQWQSVFVVLCFQRKRGWVICPSCHSGQQDGSNFRFRGARNWFK